MGPRGRTFRTHRTRRLLSRMLSQASPGLARGRRIVGGSGLRASRTGLAGVNEATHCRLQIANSSAAGRAGLRESADAGRAALCGARYLLVAPNSELRAAGRKPFSAPAVRLPSRARRVSRCSASSTGLHHPSRRLDRAERRARPLLCASAPDGDGEQLALAHGTCLCRIDDGPGRGACSPCVAPSAEELASSRAPRGG